ncbi:dTDP-4-dehydrorhamnose reductase [Marinospirillum celere]|uniref:dTDP-4-dehydrorhamnose reductase n=1 Tax=Marinospirillum celere TaxID=1122252 RepID=A0A1I1I4A0_9GAMM|nr:sugar nucleotide-binding protein [Marinospirillum celere]SFC31034.1 dTDP-4-dehydrorhamnose reductase [Marinospirillum celere]
MRLLFLSDYQAFFQALEEEAKRYASLEIVCCDSQTQPLALPDFDFLLVAPLGQSCEVGLAADLEQLEFWQNKLPQLVELCTSRQARLVLWSSDLVFNPGQQAVSELDIPENTSPLSQLLTSLEKQAVSCGQSIILRTPPSLSSDPKGGLAQLVSKCKAHKAPDNIDYRGLQPLDDVARVLLGILLQIDAGAQASGIYHYAGSEPVSQTELLHTLARYLKTPAYPADPSGTNRQGMNSRHLLENFGVHPRAWRSCLPTLLEQLNEISSTHE